tara:strand:+ start:5478 stop:6806 length:1329 start_codon:yes stop_codon:yes gene_type:complete
MNYKDKYGEVFTPHFFIKEMMDDLITYSDISYSNLTIFEPGSGKGAFFDVLQNQNNIFKDNYKYIFNEINAEHLKSLKEIGGNSNKVHYLIKDIFDINLSFFSKKIDLVIGNLPFNTNEKKFVPSLSINNKDDKKITKPKSITLWSKIVHFCFQHLLKDNGYFFAIIPCIWLKKDKDKIYSLFTKENTIIFIKIFDSVSANKIFEYNCQTPICYVLVKKTPPPKNIAPSFYLYDKHISKYSLFTLENSADLDLCIPTNHIGLFIKHREFLTNQNCSSCFDTLLKISTLNPECLKGTITKFAKGGLENFDCNNGDNVFKIITGALFNKKTDKLSLNGFTSSKPCLYYGKPKIILPHKRLARFFKDYNGEYSCFGRDFYVFLCEKKEDIDKLYHFFNIPIVNKMIQEGFTIRMNFIEKYVFQYIPWIFDSHFDHANYQELLMAL